MPDTYCRVLFYEDGRALVFIDLPDWQGAHKRWTNHAEAFQIAMRCMRNGMRLRMADERLEAV